MAELIKTTVHGSKSYRNAKSMIKEKKEQFLKNKAKDKNPHLPPLEANTNNRLYQGTKVGEGLNGYFQGKKAKLIKRRKANKVARASRKINR